MIEYSACILAWVAQMVKSFLRKNILNTKKELQDPGDGLRVQAPVAFRERA
jgi:hypothetical protein